MSATHLAPLFRARCLLAASGAGCAAVGGGGGAARGTVGVCRAHLGRSYVNG